MEHVRRTRLRRGGFVVAAVAAATAGAVAAGETGCRPQRPPATNARERPTLPASSGCIAAGSIRLCPDRVEESGFAVTVSDDILRSDFPDSPGERKLGPWSRLPVKLETGAPVVDAVWRLALEEIRSLERTETIGGTRTRFNAGASWAQAWTRDSSYAADLGLVLVFPEEIRASLDASVDRSEGHPPRALQDECGHFRGWPNLTDSIVWSLGSSEWRKAQGGDLAGDYAVIQATLRRAEEDAFDPQDGLFRGVASFMESHSAYPRRFAFPSGPANGRIGLTKALSTNVLYVRGYEDAAWMAGALGRGEEAVSHATRARALSDAINAAFWNATSRTYGYFKDERGAVERRWEGLGSLLACRVGVAAGAGDGGGGAAPHRARAPRCASVLDAEPTTPHGTPCLWPRYVEWLAPEARWDPKGTADYYHNGMVWPFVEAYAGWMAAREGRAERLARSLAFLTAMAGRDLTHRELHHPVTGRGGGSRAQLWSAAGYVGLILRGVLGTDLATRLVFRPNVPALFGGRIRVSGLRYRDAVLDVTVRGAGSTVRAVRLDGQPRSDAGVPVALRGAHAVEIDLDGSR